MLHMAFFSLRVSARTRFKSHVTSLINSNCIRLYCIRKYAATTATTPTSSASGGVWWSSDAIRQTFLDYYRQQHNHEYVHSSSVLPTKGKGTYFVNAGMNQFKPIFLGNVGIQHPRVCNVQKCIRVGGKHNDLIDVGHDVYHHTFFEMLGNWSFADYFKEDACSMAWKLLTEVFKIPADRLYVTYYAGNNELSPDIECKEIWTSLGVKSNHISAFGGSDNFWEMGDTGPCGPCTEIHYDHVGNRDASLLVNTGNPEVTEIWNIVFVQYNRLPDQTLVPLPQRHVDTGMGFERLVGVLQGHQSNYDTDVFRSLFTAIQQSCQCPQYSGRIGTSDELGRLDTAYRIIADHIRMITVSITDGLLPGNSNTEHKLKLILDRSLHQAQTVFRAPTGFLSSLVPHVIDSLEYTYPELAGNQQKVIDVIGNYEERYLTSLHEGERAFKKAVNKLKIQDLLKGEDILQLYEGRFGKPLSLSLIQNFAEQNQLKLDLNTFYKKLNQQKDKVLPSLTEIKSKTSLNTNLLEELHSTNTPMTDDSLKYDFQIRNNEYQFPNVESEIVGLLYDGKLVSRIDDGAECGVLVKKTPFYAEGGGQVADTGTIDVIGIQESCCLYVENVQKYENYVLHIGSAGGSLRVGDKVQLRINQDHRTGCMRNHSATHLLNFALRQVFPNIHQRGSHVSSNRLTFDFSCTESLKSEQLEKISGIVNELIDEDCGISRSNVKLSLAKTIENLISIKEESYPDIVNVVTIGEAVVSELCGGTHALNTGDIGRFAVVSATGVAQGTKRIVAITGAEACQAFESAEEAKNDFMSLNQDISIGINQSTWYERLKKLDRISSEVVMPKCERDWLVAAVDQIRHKVMEFHNQQLKAEKLQKLDVLLSKSDAGIVAEFPFTNSREAMQLIAKLTNQRPLILLTIENNRLVKGVCYVPPDLNSIVDIDEWTTHVCSYLQNSRCNKPTARIKGISPNSIRQFASKDTKNIQIAIARGEEYLKQIMSDTSRW